MKTTKTTIRIKILLSLLDGCDNKLTLRVKSDEFGALKFRLYSGWTSSGMPHALANLQAKGRCPATIDGYDTIEELVADVTAWVHSGTKRVAETRLAAATEVGQ